MSTDILNMLQSMKTERMETRKPIKPLNITPTIDRIEVVVNRNRLDVWFTDKPCQEFRAILKAFNWYFSPERGNSWYNKDTPENRQFLISRFGISGSQFEQNEPVPELVPTDEPIPAMDHAEERFIKYRDQVNQLCEHYGFDKYELLYFAIDRLFKETIN